MGGWGAGIRPDCAGRVGFFIHNLQNAMSAAELHNAAVEALGSIFDCRPELDFTRNLDSNGDDSVAHIEPQGYITLKALRRFLLLSDDLRLREFVCYDPRSTCISQIV